MLNEKKAWLRVAEIISSSAQISFGLFSDEIYLQYEDYIFYGMCGIIIHLFQHKEINLETERKMLLKIKKAMRKIGLRAGYLYEPTAEGMKQRIEFCQQRANRTKA